ncbi:MobQ family relaxase [Methylobacterium oryzae]|uniref:MobQ family relaxase n=1 Tax=Methylobacterium oryzae TaxID=334852 RepID=UPI002F3524F8
MALYHFSAYIVGRKEERHSSAVRLAAYQSRAKLTQDRTSFDPPNSDYHHDWTRKGGLVHEEIVAPKTAPEWAHDRERLWNAAHQAEKRKDSQLARWFDVALPSELSHQQRVQLVRGFVHERYVKKGLVADFAIHAPEEGNNHHAHFLISTRELKGDGFAPTKHPEMRGMIMTLKKQLVEEREAWADHVNRAYERANLPHRVDHRSYADRLIDRKPTVHMGYQACKLENSGQPSRAADRNKEILRQNAEIAERARKALETAQVKAVIPHTGPPRRPITPVFNYRNDPVSRNRFEAAIHRRHWDELTKLQNREALHLLDLGRKQQPQKVELQADQERRNGAFRRTIVAEVEAIERRLQNKGTTRFFRDIFGFTRRDERQMHLHIKTLAGVAMREKEEMRALETEHANQRIRVMERYAKLRAKLEETQAYRKAKRAENLNTMSDRDDRRLKQELEKAQGHMKSQTERPPPKPVPTLQPARPKAAGRDLMSPTSEDAYNRKVQEWAKTPESKRFTGIEPKARDDFSQAPEKGDFWNDHKREQRVETISKEWLRSAENRINTPRENNYGNDRDRE